MIKIIEKKFEKSFTLVEILVGVFIFSLLVVLSSGIFVSGLRNQKYSIDNVKLLNQVSYAIEYMGRSLRMAKKELKPLPTDPPSCLVTPGFGVGYNYETNAARDRIRFLNYENRCQEFFFSNGQMMERLSNNNSASDPSFSNYAVPITSDDFEITFFRIDPYSTSWSQPPIDTNNLQPRVTIIFEIKARGKSQPKLMVQTAVSQRNLDVQR